MLVLLNRILEVVRTEYRRCCEDHIVNVSVKKLLVRVETYEAVCLRNLLVVFVLDLVAEAVETVSEYVCKCSDLDVVRSLEYIVNCS